MTTQVKPDELVNEFYSYVNMTRQELQQWLNTEESQSVGQTNAGETESIGHQSGQKTLALLDKAQYDLTPADMTHMQKVVSYIKRHSQQGPTAQPKDTSPWRYSLMNWGHDPLKAD
jgi:hypothetical protein